MPKKEIKKITKTIVFIGEERHPEIYGVKVAPMFDREYVCFKEAPLTLPTEEADILLNKELYGAYNFVEVLTE